nr:hypothetical protein P5656_00990 [Bacillus subtilis]
MKKEPERYIYDEQESQETTRLISEAYQSGLCRYARSGVFISCRISCLYRRLFLYAKV